MIFRLALVIGLFSSLALGQVTQQMTLEQMRRDLARVDKSLEETRQKLKTVRDARFLPDLYFALAEFNVEKSRYMFAIKVAENPKTPMEELDFTGERRPKMEAIEAYDMIIDKFPKLPERDKAFFFKAHELRELGKLEDMVKTYAQLTKEYPDSEFWTEAQVIIGDYFFEEKKDVDLAMEVYQKILARPPGPFTPLANYKLGWCLINKVDFKKSLLSFEKVLNENKDVDLSKLPEIFRKTDVRRDALLAMVWPYSEILPKEIVKMGSDLRGKPLEYFYSLSPDPTSYEKVLSRLGRRLALKVRMIETTQVYFELLRDTKDIETRMDVVERLYVAMKNSQKPWPVHGLVQEIAKTLPLIQNSATLKEAEKKKAMSDWEIFARDIATRSQKRAKETRDKSDWEWAIRDYQAYLSAFPNSKFAPILRLNLAESQFAFGKIVEAARTYEELARQTKNPERRKEFLDSAIQAYIMALRSQSELSRLELTEVRFGLRDVGKDFVKANPNDKASEDIRFNIAQTYYDERNFDEAVKGFKEYIQLYPHSSNTSVAANLILDSFNQREDYKGIIREGNDLLKNKNLKDSNLRAQIQQIVQQAEMRGVQKAAGDFGSPDYAANLMKLARKYKGSSLGDQALYEAFVAMRAKKDPRAYESGEQLLLQHSKSKYAQEVVTSMGQMALMTADFRRAALYFELFYDRYHDKPEARDLLKNAAQIRELLGDFKLAARDYGKLGDYDRAAKQDYLAQDWVTLTRSSAKAGGINAAYYEGLAQYRLRGLGPASASLEKAASAQSNQYDDQEKAAHALYLLSMGAMASYKQIQLKAGQEVKNVQEKSGLLKDLDYKLKKVIAFGNGRWTIAALYGLGQANQEFAEFIRKAPIPAGLSPAQQQQFKTAIESQAVTYDQNAKSFFDQCIQNAEKFEIFTRFALGCRARGREAVDEAQETKVTSRAQDKDPSGVNEFRKKLFDQPRNAQMLIQLSNMYLKGQDYAMAELILNRASEIEPENTHILASIGVVKMFKNELMDAKNWFEKALSKKSNESLALWGLAGLYRQFNFAGKFQTVLPKAKSSGRPSGPIHPFMEKALSS